MNKILTALVALVVLIPCLLGIVAWAQGIIDLLPDKPVDRVDAWSRQRLYPGSDDPNSPFFVHAAWVDAQQTVHVRFSRVRGGDMGGKGTKIRVAFVADNGRFHAWDPLFLDVGGTAELDVPFRDETSARPEMRRVRIVLTQTHEPYTRFEFGDPDEHQPSASTGGDFVELSL